MGGANLKTEVAKVESEHADPGPLEITEPTVRYGVVFFLLLGIYLGASFTTADWMTPVLLAMAAATVVVLAMPTQPSRHSVMTFLAVFVGGTSLSVALATSSRRLSGISDLIVSVMLIFAITVIARTIVSAKQVTAEAVVGAVDMYILLGLSFGFLYSGVERISEVAFFSTEVLSDRSDFLYFSFVAMTTLGFGDLAPADNYARPLTVFEVLTGQIILVVVVARVVSMLGPREPDRLDTQ